jgi:hypothetical protein
VSQEPHDPPSQVLDASRMFLLDLQAAAHAALQLITEAGSPGTSTRQMDAAWLQTFGDNLARLQSWIIVDGNPFAKSGVGDVQVLVRLDILHSQIAEVISRADRLALSAYFEQSADIIQLLKAEPGTGPNAVNIEFMLKTLRVALEESPQNIDRTALKSAQETSARTRSQKIKIFVAAGEAGVDAAEQLAVNLRGRKIGPTAIDVVQSWTELPDLSTHGLHGMVSAISGCQYGALVLLPEEASAGVAGPGPATTGIRHLRLPADLDFLLGLMVGILRIENTFLVVPETEEAQLSQLLIGIVRAAYDPGKLDTSNAMDNVCSEIRQTISSQEKRARGAFENGK